MDQIRINQTIKTTLGDGLAQGIMLYNDQPAILTRIKLTDENRKHLKRDYCVTPRATSQALFLITPEMMKG